MPIDSLGSLAPLHKIERLAPTHTVDEAQSASSGFAAVLNGLLAGNQQANATANAAINDLATGKSQDLHTVSLAVAQADMSFRLILELRNRLTDAFQEIARMQV